ncbi:S-methyl-5-thioribose-1-phosphate isomerase [Mangrovihabitans endophyticus]|uniref:Methylthioribose-1-phosphate isomerase n=1 Tax=Mangrovihabitans endophyticus TaxID=1751298 RepID=A0A8J3BWX0_9ACTN|nr:S-methyl-5-thioribose-1-phosphate isomerase [Mangrovihabitans endophyticus]GGK78944.1 methylthioribose-1-phosphate isomerase [Mangrovihabitans endophyticus]
MERTLDWDHGVVVTVDQSLLPQRHRRLRLGSVDELIDAITRLAIRGAPALGAAGALGVALSAHTHRHGGRCDEAAVRRDAERLTAARPTAVNLAWGVRRALTRLADGPDAVLDEARLVLSEDETANLAAAQRAAALIRRLCPDRPLRLLTHCHTGRLATVAHGTALGAIRELAGAGRVLEVLAGETRPLLQGARLTSWELAEAGIAYRLCVDSAGPAAIVSGAVDCVVVGADRVAANGDTANKIGTLSVALAARHAGIPLVVVAPRSTIDPAAAHGGDIPVEERDPHEVTHFAGRPVAPPGARVFNPAFDVTPASLITAVVTEDGVFPGHAESGVGQP